MSARLIVLCVITLVCGVWVLAWGFLNSGTVRNAGLPHGLPEIEGRWVLDHVRGELEAEPPESIWFSAGTIPSHVRLSDGTRSAEFAVEMPGRLIFGEGHRFEPLLPSGATEVHAMTHFCPPMPAWDHLCFYPDGRGGPGQRAIVYERE